jgi:Tfp pilus assembly protein PilX
MRNSDQQSGFVAILTVIFFTLLMSVISVGFLRLMVQEQQQALQDDLSKSAYQSAQAGTEDAKRAMLYCDSLSGLAKAACDTALYHPTCPGFGRRNDIQ